MADDHISKKCVVYRIAGMEHAAIRQDVVYRTTDAGPLTMDLYYPEHMAAGARLPAVVLVAGYNDVGFEQKVGCKFKEMASAISWAQLIAASGLVAIAYTNREPAADLDALLAHLRQNADALGIDKNRLGVWACSGHVPLALAALARKDHAPGPTGPGLRCAVLLYGMMSDLDEPPALPLFIARAGRDQFEGFNDSIDRFVAKALAGNRPLTFVNHATGPHAFDLLDDSETSRAIVRQVLGFLRSQLLVDAT